MKYAGLALVAVGAVAILGGVLAKGGDAFTLAGVGLMGAGFGLSVPVWRPQVLGVVAIVAGLALGFFSTQLYALAAAWFIVGLGAGLVGGALVLPLVGIGALTVLALGLTYLILSALRPSGGAFAEGWRLLFTPPYSLARTFTALTVAFLLVAAILTPITWLETRSLRAFMRREEELRAARPEDVVTPYEGAEGEGVAFDGAGGRLLLLKPAAGIGPVRELVLPPSVSVATDATPSAPERPSAADSSQ